MATEPTAVKLTVTLSKEVVQALQDMAAANGVSVPEQLRRAISTQKWLQGVLDRNERILVENSAGRLRMVEFGGGRYGP